MEQLYMVNHAPRLLHHSKEEINLKTNKKNYETPEMEIILFKKNDIVTFSNGTSNSGGDTPLGEVENDGTW